MDNVDFSTAVGQTARHFDMDVSRPLVMVSGGPDSIALLRVLIELGSRPIVLYVDHGLRAQESREEAEFVQELCTRLGITCEVRHLEIKGGNLQDRARRERYRIAEELAGEGGFSTIATGHTADDVAETVLMNLARGAGLRGLSGIPPVRDRVVRPLIRHHRKEILRYLEYLGQSYRVDHSNLIPKYTRNSIRLGVLPALEELYPGTRSNIARGAALLREDLEILEGLVAGTVHRRSHEVVVSLDELRTLQPALRRHAVRRAYSVLTSDASFLASTTIEGILELTRRREGTRTVDLPGNVVAAVRFGMELAFYYKVKLSPREEALSVGEVRFADWIVSTREVREYDPEDAARQGVAYLNASHGPYWVRMAREGDIIRPLGLRGTKKVFRAMMDRKVPKDLRPHIPVVVNGLGRVAWIFLGDLDEEFKVSAEVEKILRLEVHRTRGDA